MNKVEELIAASKLGELMQKKQAEEEKKDKTMCILAIVGVVVALGVAIYFIWKTFSEKKAFDDFDDDFDDDFEDDFFADEDEFEEDIENDL